MVVLVVLCLGFLCCWRLMYVYTFGRGPPIGENGCSLRLQNLCFLSISTWLLVWFFPSRFLECEFRLRLFLIIGCFYLYKQLRAIGWEHGPRLL